MIVFKVEERLISDLFFTVPWKVIKIKNKGVREMYK